MPLPPDIASSVASALQARVDDDEEWEYEYDEQETEDVYFTLDLTTHVPDALDAKAKAANGRAKPVDPTEDDEDAQDGDARDVDSNDGQTPASAVPIPRKINSEPSTLQILNLHSDNPLVKFGSGIYSCQWSTDLGTQFFVSRPGVVDYPLRPGHVADVIGISQARLLGRPVKFEQRADWVRGPEIVDGPVEMNADPSEGTDATYMPGPNNSEEQSVDQPGQPLLIPRENLTKPEYRAQASFLERLSAIKLRKGEMDPVPATYRAIRYEGPPSNWQETRDQALAEDQRNVVQEAEAAPKPRKRRRLKYNDIGLQTKKDAGTSRGDRWTRLSNAGVKANKELRAAMGLQDAPMDDEDEEGDGEGSGEKDFEDGEEQGREESMEPE